MFLAQNANPSPFALHWSTVPIMHTMEPTLIIAPVDSSITASHHQLLLEADPDTNQIATYLREGDLYEAKLAEQLVGVMLLTVLPNDGVEIKNIAVLKSYRGRGFGAQLIRFAIATAKQRGASNIYIGTGNSSLSQLALYQRCGFRLERIERDFFADYPKPIYENGIRCLDMVWLGMALSR